MYNELKSLKESYEKGKEDWKKKALEAMANSIIQEVSPINSLVQLNENRLLKAVQGNLGIFQKGEPKEEEKKIISKV